MYMYNVYIYTHGVWDSKVCPVYRGVLYRGFHYYSNHLELGHLMLSQFIKALIRTVDTTMGSSLAVAGTAHAAHMLLHTLQLLKLF